MEMYKLEAKYNNNLNFQGTFYDDDGLEMAKEIAKLFSTSNKFSQITLTFQEDKKIDFLGNETE